LLAGSRSDCSKSSRSFSSWHARFWTWFMNLRVFSRYRGMLHRPWPGCSSGRHVNWVNTSLWSLFTEQSLMSHPLNLINCWLSTLILSRREYESWISFVCLLVRCWVQVYSRVSGNVTLHPSSHRNKSLSLLKLSGTISTDPAILSIGSSTKFQSPNAMVGTNWF
jgi:hypothetical protein